MKGMVLGEQDVAMPPTKLALERIAVTKALPQLGDRVRHWARMVG